MQMQGSGLAAGRGWYGEGTGCSLLLGEGYAVFQRVMSVVSGVGGILLAYLSRTFLTSTMQLSADLGVLHATHSIQPQYTEDTRVHN